MAARRDLERAVRSYVALGCGLDPSRVIPGNDNGPAPSGTYATVLLIHSAQRGIPPSVGADFGGQLQARTLSSICATYSVQWFRAGAWDLGEMFRVWLDSPQGVESAVRRGLTYLGCSELRQIDSVISRAWETRAELDVELGYTQRMEAPVHVVERVPLRVGELPEVIVDGS